MKTEELIGKQILSLFIEYIYDEKYDCTVEQIYLNLDKIGVVTIPDDENDSEIIELKKNFKLHEDNSKVAGSKIKDVLISEMLPYYNLLLSNGILIYCDSPTPTRFNWYVDNFSEMYQKQYEYTSIK